MVALGELQVARGQWGAAEASFQEALEHREARLGVDHPWLDEVLEGLLGVYQATGRPADATAIEQRRAALTHDVRPELAS
jgi:uncharacterized protein HemY